MKEPLSRKFHSVLLFLFCGIPGLVLVLASATMFCLFTDLDKVSIRQIVLASTILALGTCFALLGVRKLHQWLYGLVLLAFPVSLVLWGLYVQYFYASIELTEYLISLAVCSVFFPHLALYFVAKYYRTHQRETRMDRELETAQQSGASSPHSPSAQGADGR